MSPIRAAAVFLPLLSGLPCSDAVGGAAHGIMASAHPGSGRIMPPLHPKDDHSFFKHDYPDDRSPEMEDKWSHPFPLVQGHKDYDKDFVRDENYDNGEWQLQNEYDSLRSRLAAASAKRDRASREAEAAGNEMQATRKQEEDARARAEAALEAKTRAEREAQEVLREAEKKYHAANRKSVDGADVEKQQAVADQEARDMEACQKELDAARMRLRELQAQKLEAEAKVRKYAAIEEAAGEKQLDKEEAEAELEDRVDKVAKEYDAAHRQYEAAAAEEQNSKRQVQDAEARLRHYRHPEEDAKKGGAVPTGGSISLMVVALLFVAKA